MAGRVDSQSALVSLLSQIEQSILLEESTYQQRNPLASKQTLEDADFTTFYDSEVYLRENLVKIAQSGLKALARFEDIDCQEAVKARMQTLKAKLESHMAYVNEQQKDLKPLIDFARAYQPFHVGCDTHRARFSLLRSVRPSPDSQEKTKTDLEAEKKEFLAHLEKSKDTLQGFLGEEADPSVKQKAAQETEALEQTAKAVQEYLPDFPCIYVFSSLPAAQKEISSRLLSFENHKAVRLEQIAILETSFFSFAEKLSEARSALFAYRKKDGLSAEIKKLVDEELKNLDGARKSVSAALTYSLLGLKQYLSNWQLNFSLSKNSLNPTNPENAPQIEKVEKDLAYIKKMLDAIGGFMRAIDARLYPQAKTSSASSSQGKRKRADSEDARSAKKAKTEWDQNTVKEFLYSEIRPLFITGLQFSKKRAEALKGIKQKLEAAFNKKGVDLFYEALKNYLFGQINGLFVCRPDMVCLDVSLLEKGHNDLSAYIARATAMVNELVPETVRNPWYAEWSKIHQTSQKVLLQAKEKQKGASSSEKS